MTLTKNGLSLLSGSSAVTVICIFLFYAPAVLFSFLILTALAFFVLEFHWRVRKVMTTAIVTRDVSTQKTVAGVSVHAKTTILIDVPNLIVEVSDQIPRSFGLSAGSNQGMLEPGEHKLELDYDVVPNSKGRTFLGPVLVQVKDPLGLDFATFRLNNVTEVVVLPRLHSPGKLLARSILATTALTKPLRGPLWVRAEEFRELREFVPGDSPRDIAWRATAKSSTADLYVKEMEKDTEVNLIAVLDTSPSTAAGDFTQNFMELAIDAVMALFEFVSNTNDKFGLLVWGSDSKIYIPPDKGSTQLKKLREAFGRLTPQQGYSSVNDALKFLSKELRQTSLIMVFSRLPFDEPTSLLRTIISTEQRGWRVVVILPDELSFLRQPENTIQKATFAVAQELERDRLLKISSILVEGYRVSVVDRPKVLTQSLGKFIEIRRPRMAA